MLLQFRFKICSDLLGKCEFESPISDQPSFLRKAKAVQYNTLTLLREKIAPMVYSKAITDQNSSCMWAS